MSDFKVIQNITIEELNAIIQTTAIKCENCLFLDKEKYCTFNDYIPRVPYCPAFVPKEKSERNPLRTLSIEPYKLDK